MRRLILIICCLLLVACSDPAREKFETARFEEQQFNRPHALQLYEEIVSRHSDSTYARQAAARLEELRKQAPAEPR